MKVAGAKPDTEAEDGVEGEEKNTWQGAFRHTGLLEMAGGLEGDEKGGGNHDEAKKKGD